MTKTKTQQEIERLVNKYPRPDSRDLFRAELEYLVLIAEGEQIVADHKDTMRIIGEKGGVKNMEDRTETFKLKSGAEYTVSWDDKCV